MMHIDEPSVWTPAREAARWRLLFRLSLAANFVLAAALAWALRR